MTLQSRANSYSHGFYEEQEFQQQLVQERKRAERAGKPLLVMILSFSCVDGVDAAFWRSLGEGVLGCLRETDLCGALKGTSAGAILVEVPVDKIEDAKKAVGNKVRSMLENRFGGETAKSTTIAFRLYPETGGEDSAFDMVFYPDITDGGLGKTAGIIAKRVVDVIGSALALGLLSPIFLLLPLAIKVTSKGPVLFVQERYGLNGVRFNLFKFRSMHINNDDGIHREFVKQLIDGTLSDGGTTVYKITSDPRITVIGKIIRAYSLDELPQLFNVLRGDMSLVGPRPPIHYEVENYSSWQRNRLVGKRPGITGAWQVSGRSSTTFDDMVRLDLRYLKNWSVLLDIKIILLTPLAVLRCRGAY